VEETSQVVAFWVDAESCPYVSTYSGIGNEKVSVGFRYEAREMFGSN
jgi:hypothetical protein